LPWINHHYNPESLIQGTISLCLVAWRIPMNKIDAFLDLLATTGISLDLLVQRSHERTSQLEGDSNEIKINNNHLHKTSSGWVELDDIVPATVPAAVKEANQQRPELKNISPARLWRDFVNFNRIKGRTGSIRIQAFLGFLRVWEDRLTKTRPKKPFHKRSEAPVAPLDQEVHYLASLAPSGNRAFHRRDLERLWGTKEYVSRVSCAAKDFSITNFMASLVVHGLAVKEGIIPS